MESWKRLMREWIEIKSIYSEETKTKKAPFGRGVADAIHWIAERAQEDGFNVFEEAGSYTVIDYGVGVEYIGVFCHCDVVPAGSGWETDPFKLTKRAGKFYGRGVVDNKGPAICAYLAMKAMKEKGIRPNRKIRLFIGGNEESGFRSIRKYLEENVQPVYGFVPDAKFPVLHGERGGGIVRVEGQIESLLQMKAGEVSNVIPDSLKVWGECLSVRQKQKLERNGIIVRARDDGYQLKGRGGHASKPKEASALIKEWLVVLDEGWSNELLKLLNFDSSWAKGIQKVGQCGSLQITPTVLKIDGQYLKLTCDIRYPETITMHELQDEFDCFSKKEGDRFIAKFIDHKKARYMKPDHPLVTELLSLYRAYGGNPKDQPRLTSAGTYMSELENTVIFGMESSHGESGNIHGPNEFISEEQVKFGIEIYTRAFQLMNSW